jgi:hypothetical protein
MGCYLGHGFGPVGKCGLAGPCHQHLVGAVTMSGLCAHRRRVGGRGGVGFSRLARGRFEGGARQGDSWSGSLRRSGIDEVTEAALGGGVPTTARSSGGRRRSGKNPAAPVSGRGG